MGDRPFQLRLARPVRAAVFGLGLTAALSGCATPVAHRPGGAYVGEAGASWNVVLPSPDVAQTADAWSEANAEYARRDYALGVPPDTSQDLRDAWSQPAQPDIDQVRRVFISTRPESVTIFRSTSPSTYRRGWDYSSRVWPQ